MSDKYRLNFLHSALSLMCSFSNTSDVRARSQIPMFGRPERRAHYSLFKVFSLNDQWPPFQRKGSYRKTPCFSCCPSTPATPKLSAMQARRTGAPDYHLHKFVTNASYRPITCRLRCYELHGNLSSACSLLGLRPNFSAGGGGHCLKIRDGYVRPH